MLRARTPDSTCAACAASPALSTTGRVTLSHSYGAHCVLEAALLTAGMRRLVLYEPAVIAVTPPGWVDRMDDLLAQGRPEQVVIALLRDLAGMTAEQLELAMSLPSWPNRVAAAHTVVRETRAEDAAP